MSLDREGGKEGGREGRREGEGREGEGEGREGVGEGGREGGVTDCYTYSNIIQCRHSI